MIINIAKSFFEFTIRTNIISSIASAFMTMLFEWALGVWSGFKLPAISAMYVFSMYSVNNYFAKSSLKESNPFKYKLHKKNSVLIIIITLLFLLISQYLIFTFSLKLIVVYYILLVTGILYTTPMVRKFVQNLPRNVQIIYKMKSMIATSGWILICSLPIWMIPVDIFTSKIIIILTVFTFAAYMIITRNLLHDIIGYHGDLIIGSNTLPLSIGMNGSRAFHVIISITSALLTILYSIISHEMLILLFLVNILYYNLIFNKVSRLKYFVTLEYEILVDANFLLFIIITGILMF